ncbi:UNVERIFIED_CONTAM: hypothetical protein RMT77_007831 [Armadillidium vulgare]
MPMLAEPKKKSKLTLNPRGTLWANDENKFGQKLLEKMGWAKGKGLGKNEQGVKNPIRVSGNSDNKGMGFSGNPDLSTDHYENFEDVLASLNSANNSDSSSSESEKDSINLKNIESLEMKSKNSRARVHYSKFTRGKDLSLYNENDLACVLGTKKILKRKSNNEMKSQDQNESAKEVVIEEKVEESDAKENFTYYGGNIKDYFNQKMEELKRKRSEGLLGDEETPSKAKNETASPPETPFPDLEFEPEKSNFSFNISVQDSDVKERYSEAEEKEEFIKMKSKEDSDDKVNDKKKKRKKSKKNKDCEKVESISECLEEEKHTEITEEYNVDEDERDDKARKLFKNDYAEEIHSSDKESKKKKKKKKYAKEEDNISNSKSEQPPTESESELNIKDEIQSHCSNMNESYVKATSTAEKKKKKKRKEADEEASQEKENGDISRPLKKLRKLASEISLPEILKSSSEKLENENNINCEIENQEVEEENSNSKVKLKNKKSFKGLKSDFEMKFKEKFKKISKTELVPIEEESVIEKNETKKSETSSSKIVSLNVPVGYDNGDYMYSAPKQYKTVQFDIEKTFPNSNLEKIKGYFKS